jgi:hypothetical protein
MIKRLPLLFFLIAGGYLFGWILYWFYYFFGKRFYPVFKSDSEIANSILIYLTFQFVFFIIGAGVGYLTYYRCINRIIFYSSNRQILFNKLLFCSANGLSFFALTSLFMYTIEPSYYAFFSKGVFKNDNFQLILISTKIVSVLLGLVSGLKFYIFIEKDLKK